MTKIEDAAAWYQAKGWPTVYIRNIYIDPDGKKDVQGAEKWETATADMPVRRGQSQTSNAIGVRTGEISGVMFVDVDGYCPKWRELLAEHGLPYTWTVQTRTGGFHYGFKWDARMERFTKNDVGLATHTDENNQKLGAVDLRANGRIVFAPPTVCSDGSAYELKNRTDPAEMPDWLFEALCQWQDEKIAAKESRRRAAPANITPMSINESDGRLSLALGEIQAAVDGEKHDVLNRSSFTIGGLVAGGVVEMDRAVELIEEACRVNGGYPFDNAQIATMHRALNDGTNSPIESEAPFDELFAEVRTAPKAEAVVSEAGVLVIDGPIDWDLRIDPIQESNGSIDLAMKIAQRVPAYDETRILTHFDNTWWFWNGRHWELSPPHDVFDSVARSLAPVKIAKVDDEGKISTTPLRPGVTKINDVEAMMASALRRRVRNADQEPNRDEIAIPLQNGVVTSTPTERFRVAPSPTIWSTAVLPFDYDPYAAAPMWLQFLKETFQHDPDAVDALQEWFGYFLAADPEWMQKMFWIIGPPRSGKGTIIKVAKALMGRAATGTNLTALGSDMAGKENLIGKSLAIIDDARDPDPRVAHRVTEFLLTATSGGVNVINRKYQTPWEGALTAVFLAASNTVPRFPDEGGAIGSRFEIIKTRVSREGTEDLTLIDRLLTELPGVLNWALDGLDRLRQQGEFTRANQAAAVREGIDRGATSATPMIKDHLIAAPDVIVDGIILKSLTNWWSSQQMDDYKPNAPSIANAIRAEFIDVEERKVGHTQDGRKSIKGWRGIAVKCRECDNVASRISAYSGPECNLHMTSEAQGLLTR